MVAMGFSSKGVMDTAKKVFLDIERRGQILGRGRGCQAEEEGTGNEVIIRGPPRPRGLGGSGCLLDWTRACSAVKIGTTCTYNILSSVPY